MTVQRALQNKPGVRPQTAKRIQRIARSHGYLPNAAATATRTGRFDAIGLVIGSVTPRYLPAELVHGVEQSLIHAGLQLLFASLPDQDLADESRLPRVLQHLMVDGLLIHYTHDFPERTPDLIANHRLPCIWINTKLEYDCVYLDDFAGAYDATRVLIDQGHHRIAYANCDPRGHYSEVDRLAGYNKAMREAGLSPRAAELPYPNRDRPHEDDRLERAHAMLAGEDRPTAVLAYSGATHAGPIAMAAQSLGLSIPRDLSLITFDRSPFSPIGLPLTSVSTSMEPAGRIAVEMLRQKIEQPTQPIPSRRLPPTINPLMSVAPPPRA